MELFLSTVLLTGLVEALVVLQLALIVISHEVVGCYDVVFSLSCAVELLLVNDVALDR